MAVAAVTYPTELLRELFAHMEWADAAVWRAALSHGPAMRDARLRDLLFHIHLVQRAFLSVWTDRLTAFPEAGEFEDIAAVRWWGQPVYAELHTFLESADQAALARPVVLPWAVRVAQLGARSPVSPSLAETMFQVVSHSIYHRGQATMRLRELDGTPPLVDFIAWIWFDRPRPEW